MKKRHPLIALLLVLTTVLSMAPMPALAASADPFVVTGYRLTDAEGKTLKSIRTGKTGTLTVSFRHTEMTNDQLASPNDLDVIRQADSFSGGTTDITVTSSGTNPLTFDVRLTGLKYGGTGNTLGLMVGLKKQPDSYLLKETTVSEAIPAASDSTPSPDAAPTPIVLVGISTPALPIAADQEQEVTVTFRNTGTAVLQSPVAAFTPSDSLTIAGGTRSFLLKNINPGQEQTVTFRIRALPTVASALQSLAVELKFNYHNRVSLTQGSATDTLYIPAKASRASDGAVPQPPVIVSRTMEETPLQSGTRRTVKVTFENAGKTSLVSPVATFTASDGLNLLDDASSRVLADIAPGESRTVEVKLEGGQEIAASAQSLTAELKFSYDSGSALAQGSATERISIPAVKTGGAPQPVLIVSRSASGGPIVAGSETNLTLTFRNAGTVPVTSLVAAFSTSEALLLMNDNATVPLSDLKPGETASVPLRVAAGKEIASTNQYVSADLKFSYVSGGGVASATQTERVNLPAVTTANADAAGAPVPNVIVSDYRYGGESIASGNGFVLGVTFTNTGSQAIENITATIDCGDSFTTDGTANTFHYSGMAAGESLSQDVPMLVLAGVKSGAKSIEIGFKYEYLDAGKRTAATSSVKLSVPVFQPDRVMITAPQIPEIVNAGEELVLTLPYVNKGKSEVSNVEATIEGDGVETAARTQYIGNMDSGKSGTIGFAVTPLAAGVTDLVLKVSYEDESQKVRTLTFPVTLQVQEAPYFEPEPVPVGEPADSPLPLPLPALVGIGAAVAAVVALLIRKKRKAAKTAKQSEGWSAWDDEQEPAAAE